MRQLTLCLTHKIESVVYVMKRIDKISQIQFIIGITLIAKGFFYLCHGTYFVYPPNMTGIENDHIIGYSFILFGALFALIKIFPQHFPIWLRSVIVAVAIGLMMFVTIIEWCHLLALNLPMSALSNTCITLVMMVLEVERDNHNA